MTQSEPVIRYSRVAEIDIARHPYLNALVERQIAAWPEHEKTLATSFGNRSDEVMRDTEASAQLVTKIAEHHFGSVDRICADYRYFCEEMILQAELFFRRHGRYERSTFSEAMRDVYSRPDVMEKYMNGLLLSGIFWHNHACALTFYRRTFLPMLPEQYRHLEVGPGHGALLYLTATDPRAGSIAGWDVSASSVAATRRTLEVIGINERVELVCQDMLDAPDQLDAFDSVVVSEVLEHLEDPLNALLSLFRYLKPGGHLKSRLSSHAHRRRRWLATPPRWKRKCRCTVDASQPSTTTPGPESTTAMSAAQARQPLPRLTQLRSSFTHAPSHNSHAVESESARALLRDGCIVCSVAYECVRLVVERTPDPTDLHPTPSSPQDSGGGGGAAAPITVVLETARKPSYGPCGKTPPNRGRVCGEVLVDAIYRFGDFELDAVRFELRQHGACADVQPKVLRLLLHLIEQRERVVSNEELLRVLWPEATVGQGSIKRAILGARQALGERADDQTYIRTVRGFGYQFVGEVELQELSHAHDLLVVPARSDVREALLGREGVMDLLQESLQQALSGACRCVLITGGPGLGKTRIVEELLASAQQLGADAWFGRCTEVEGAPAFWPFIQVLRAAQHSRGSDELRDQWPDLPVAAPVSSTAARFRLFDSMAVFLERAAAKRPIVLALDDLHRADPASLRLLSFVVRQVQHARILILGALRPDSPDSPETAQLIEELKGASRCMALQGLRQRDIERYIALATGVEPPANVCELLHAQTAGNPLFLQHLIENWRAAGQRSGPPLWPSLVSAPLSHGLSGAIERHLELVSLPCRELLRAAAVLGTDFSAGILSRVAEQSASDTSTHLAEAAESGLLRQLGGEVGRYRFAHVLVRDALYAQLSAAERSRLHGRAANAIEAQGIGDNCVLLAEVTRHFVHAAPSHDAGRALQYSLRAAESALRTLAYEQATEHFTCALDLLLYLPPDRRQRMTLLFRKGDALARLDMPAARAALSEAATLARELGDSELLVRAAALMASRPESGSVDAAQVDVLRQALAMLRAENEQDERCPLLEALIAKSLLYDKSSDERVSLARAALIKARQLSVSEQRAEALTRCHEALPGPDHLQARLEIATELMSLAHHSGDSVALLSALSVQVETCVERGDMQGVDAALDSMDMLAERLREPYYRWNCKVVRAMREFVRGDFVSADRLIHEAWHSGAPISAALARHVYCVQSNLLLRLRGQDQQAEPLVREMMVYYPTMPGWSATWGALVWDLGQHDNARRCLARLMDYGAAATRSGAFGLASCAALTDLCCKVGDGEAAREIYDVLAPFADYHSHTTLGATTMGPVSRQLGALAECQGDAALAETHYRAALAASMRMHSPVHSSGAGYLYARMLLRAGDPRRRARAAELLSHALQLADASQLHVIGLTCRNLAKHHGVSLAELASTGERSGLRRESKA